MRILVATADVIGPRMASTGIRAWHIAGLLAAEHEVRLATTQQQGELRAGSGFEVVQTDDDRRLREQERWAEAIVLQEPVAARFPWLLRSDRILVGDLYVPGVLEVVAQGDGGSAELRAYRAATTTRSTARLLARGDFFLAAHERQRDFWLGQLAAAGRVNPLNSARSADLSALIDVAPFGIPAADPVHDRAAVRGVVPGIGPDDELLLWGGSLFDWFDPDTLVRAVGLLAPRRPRLRLLLLGASHVNPRALPMSRLAALHALVEQLGLDGSHVFFHDGWVDYDDRRNYLLEADLGVSTHRAGLETRFSFRTRMLDYLWAGLPIVCTEGDYFAELVAREGLGRAVPAGDAAALADALDALLSDAAATRAARERIATVRERFRWERALSPLAGFCREPRPAADRLSPAERRRARRQARRELAGRGAELLREEGVGAVARRLRRRAH